MSTKEYPLNTDNSVPSIRCHYCKRIAYWVRPSAGVQFCSSCKALQREKDWAGLAHRWLTNRPEDWVPDVAAFLQMDANHESTELERSTPLSVREGCDGSICGSQPHRHGRVLPVPVVVAKIVRGKELGR